MHRRVGGHNSNNIQVAGERRDEGQQQKQCSEHASTPVPPCASPLALSSKPLLARSSTAHRMVITSASTAMSMISTCKRGNYLEEGLEEVASDTFNGVIDREYVNALAIFDVRTRCNHHNIAQANLYLFKSPHRECRARQQMRYEEHRQGNSELRSCFPDASSQQSMLTLENEQ